MVYVGANEGDQITELSGDESSLDAQVTVQRLADERAALRRVAILVAHGAPAQRGQ